MIIESKNYKPKNRGVSDKFSWNLYRTLKEYEKQNITVYKFGWEPLHGECEPEEGMLLLSIGFNNAFDLSGSINRITTVGPKAVGCCVSWSGIPFSQIKKLDVTEWFFREYSRKGRCLFQGGWSHSFTTINKQSRKCIYCGKHQRKEIITSKKITREEVWL